MTRCFIALNLPIEIKSEIAAFQTLLSQKMPGWRVTWVKPGVFHLNLHFLGNLSQDGINRLQSALGALKGNFGPILGALNDLDAFPNTYQPKVLILGIKEIKREKEAKGGLVALQKEIGKILRTQNLPMETRPFVPHITLGRVKYFPRQPILPVVKINPLEFEINSFELMASELTPTGPEYKILEKYKL